MFCQKKSSGDFQGGFKGLKKDGGFIFTDLNPIDIMTPKTPAKTHKYSAGFSYFKDGCKSTSKLFLIDGSAIGS